MNIEHGSANYPSRGNATHSSVTFVTFRKASAETKLIWFRWSHLQNQEYSHLFATWQKIAFIESLFGVFWVSELILQVFRDFVKGISDEGGIRANCIDCKRRIDSAGNCKMLVFPGCEHRFSVQLVISWEFAVNLNFVKTIREFPQESFSRPGQLGENVKFQTHGPIFEQIKPFSVGRRSKTLEEGNCPLHRRIFQMLNPLCAANRRRGIAIVPTSVRSCGPPDPWHDLLSFVNRALGVCLHLSAMWEVQMKTAEYADLLVVWVVGYIELDFDFRVSLLPQRGWKNFVGCPHQRCKILVRSVTPYPSRKIPINPLVLKIRSSGIFKKKTISSTHKICKLGRCVKVDSFIVWSLFFWRSLQSEDGTHGKQRVCELFFRKQKFLHSTQGNIRTHNMYSEFNPTKASFSMLRILFEDRILKQKGMTIFNRSSTKFIAANLNLLCWHSESGSTQILLAAILSLQDAQSSLASASSAGFHSDTWNRIEVPGQQLRDSGNDRKLNLRSNTYKFFSALRPTKESGKRRLMSLSFRTLKNNVQTCMPLESSRDTVGEHWLHNRSARVVVKTCARVDCKIQCKSRNLFKEMPPYVRTEIEVVPCLWRLHRAPQPAKCSLSICRNGMKQWETLVLVTWWKRWLSVCFVLYE